MSDEELDALFRRGAAAYPDEMPPAAWAGMETALDEAARAQQLRSKVTRYFAGELILIALIIWKLLRLAVPVPTAIIAQQAAIGPRVLTEGAHHTTLAGAAPVAGPTLASSARGAASQNKQAVLLPDTKAKKVALAPLATAGAPGELAPVASAPAATTPRRDRGELARLASERNLLTGKSAHSLTGKSALSNQAASHAAQPQLATTRAFTDKQLAVRLGRPNIVGRTKRQRKGWQPVAQPLSAGPRTIAANAGGRPGQKYTEQLRKNALIQSFNADKIPGLVGGEAEESLAGRMAALATTRYPLPAALQPLAAPPAPADSARQPRRPVPRPPYRVVVGLLAGPSLSGVRTAQSAQVGADYGLTLEYLFSTRLRLRLGLLSSQKNYQAASSDYAAPANWRWPNGPYDLRANCRITEIPLDFRYDVRRRPSYAIFTSLGVNSLLMRNERYSYNWQVNGQTFSKLAEVVNGSNHFASMLNLAVGFEKPLGQRWSAQVEPFWQVPLGGVGAGQVRLTSAGAAFSLKYGLVR